MVSPRLDAGGGPPARLYAQAFHRAIDLYATVAGAAIAKGALQIETAPRDARRFDAIAASELFAPGAVVRLDRDAASARLGEPAAAGGLWQAEAPVIEPAVVLGAWLGEVEAFKVDRIVRQDGEWRLYAGEALAARADIVCLAAGPAITALAPELKLQPIRGQASFLDTAERPTSAAWGGYIASTREGLLFGATHDRDDAGDEIRAEDNRRNLADLAQARPALAAALADRTLSARAGVRAAARDLLPIAGAAPGGPGLFALGGFGGRGFCLAPLLAEHVAALALGHASPLPGDLGALIDPMRLVSR